MSLAEKITTLRGERKLSQGDLAEKLEVSRQSVSKWETGQSVPELDKLIKLADLFGISVDELVREGARPQPELRRGEAGSQAEPEPKVVYVERPMRYTPPQTLGIVLIVGGLVTVLCAVFVKENWLLLTGGAAAVLGLPLLLAKKHPFLTSGWLVLAAGYLTICNPYLTGVGWRPMRILWMWRVLSESHYSGVAWLLFLAHLGITVLTALLPLYTGWLGWKRWKGRKENTGG